MVDRATNFRSQMQRWWESDKDHRWNAVEQATRRGAVRTDLPVDQTKWFRETPGDCDLAIWQFRDGSKCIIGGTGDMCMALHPVGGRVKD